MPAIKDKRILSSNIYFDEKNQRRRLSYKPLINEDKLLMRSVDIPTHK